MSRFERGGEGSNPSEATKFKIYKPDDVRHSNSDCRIYPVYNLDFLPCSTRNKRGRKGKKDVSTRFFRSVRFL